ALTGRGPGDVGAATLAAELAAAAGGADFIRTHEPRPLRDGMAAGRVFRRGDHRHRVVIGKDTRLSGYMLR
ncbi:hypothetical protein ABTB25_19505, partial [Acinetobacter baumannii]